MIHGDDDARPAACPAFKREGQPGPASGPSHGQGGGPRFTESGRGGRAQAASQGSTSGRPGEAAGGIRSHLAVAGHQCVKRHNCSTSMPFRSNLLFAARAVSPSPLELGKQWRRQYQLL